MRIEMSLFIHAGSGSGKFIHAVKGYGIIEPKRGQGST
jgi:hypothetical protein